jgi:hypothetical protein
MNDNLDPSRIEVLDDDMVAVLREKTPVERVAMVFDANQTMRLMLEAHFRDTQPTWDNDRIMAAIARRLLGDPE